MGNDYDIPDGWAMPDDMARRLQAQLNRKRITPEGELQDALDELARNIGLD